MIRLLSFILLAATLSGCRPAVSSPLDRLNEESPVDQEAFRVIGLSIDDEDFLRPSPVCERQQGQTLSLNGRLGPNKRRITPITRFWRPRDGEPKNLPGTVGIAGELPAMLVVFIHDDDQFKDKGVASTTMVESIQDLENQPFDEKTTELKFRAEIVIPQRPGTYVMDLHYSGMTGTATDAPNDSKPVGFPIWRCVLAVQ
jgi:hypothetical protein